MDDAFGKTGIGPSTEQLFRSLYQHMGKGVALHEVILDETGEPINYRILDVNPQYEGFTGLKPE